MPNQGWNRGIDTCSGHQLREMGQGTCTLDVKEVAPIHALTNLRWKQERVAEKSPGQISACRDRQKWHTLFFMGGKSFLIPMASM